MWGSPTFFHRAKSIEKNIEERKISKKTIENNIKKR